MGRATQGVRVMNMKEDDQISAVALVVESGSAVDAPDSDSVAEPVTADAPSDADTQDGSSNGDSPVVDAD
jgi:hypothetical protein